MRWLIVVRALMCKPDNLSSALRTPRKGERREPGLVCIASASPWPARVTKSHSVSREGEGGVTKRKCSLWRTQPSLEILKVVVLIASPPLLFFYSNLDLVMKVLYYGLFIVT